MIPATAPSRRWLPAALRRPWLVGAIRLAVIGLLLGWVYGWASPKAYPRDGRLGFGYGTLHGALMPMALPALLLGQDVSIYAENNTGRSYKIGYIAGINLCGLIFFGSAFWKPSSRLPTAASAQKNQLR